MNQSSDLKALVEQHILSLALTEKQPANLYQPMHYLLSLKGKRIRPILTLLAYQAISGQAAKEALNLASSVELFHNFTLMHDDIMDRAPVRRGQPSVHIKWNEDIAILSGDALFALSMGLVVADFPEKAAVLCQEFTGVGLAVCEGQMEDMDLATQEAVSIADYLEMIRKKTAALLGGCLSLGALAGGAERETVEMLRQYGESLGLAFQLQDDLMDAFPPANFGKQVGGDIIENKKTFLLLKAFEKANPAQHAELTRWTTGEQDQEQKVAAILELFRQLGIQEETNQLIDAYFEQARSLGKRLSERCNFGALQTYLGEIVNRKL